MTDRASGRPSTDPGPPGTARSEACIHSVAGEVVVKYLVPANTNIFVMEGYSRETAASEVFSVCAAGSDREGCSTGTAAPNIFSLEAVGPISEGMKTQKVLLCSDCKRHSLVHDFHFSYGSIKSYL
uniref:Uncharacterized protein n=1 Tax=Arundo donax TaxID=35708 RepID=A0A0A9D0V6_ARUDO